MRYKRRNKTFLTSAYRKKMHVEMAEQSRLANLLKSADGDEHAYLKKELEKSCARVKGLNA